MKDAIVIIGTGLAGYTVARELRKLDARLPLHLITADDGAFYSKPMLSNALASGKTADALATFDAQAMAAQLSARIDTHTTVTAIDTAQQRLDLRQGRDGAGSVHYGKLVLALGAQPLSLPLAGDGADQVLAVNSLAHYRRFRQRLSDARRVLILGAGFVGCEFANDLAAQGIAVSVADPGPYPLSRFLVPEAGRQLQAALTKTGVHWHLGMSASEVHKDARGLRVHLQGANEEADVEVDLVLSAAGLQAHTELASAAGIACDRAIIVDRCLQTSDKNVFALGDCAQVEGLLLPFVMPLMNAARALAKTLAGDVTPVRYPPMPVVVKTPCYPLVILMPAPAAAGQWQVQSDDEGVRALFQDTDEQVLGFVLGGRYAGEKNALLKQVPPLLA